MSDPYKDVADAIALVAGQSAITFVGELERGRRAAGPRIVWIPRGGPIEPALQDEPNKKTAYQAVTSCEVYILDSTRANAMTHWRVFSSALFRSQSQISARLTDHEWSTDTLSGINRVELRLTVEVDIPLHHEEYTPAQIESISQTGTITD